MLSPLLSFGQEIFSLILVWGFLFFLLLLQRGVYSNKVLVTVFKHSLGDFSALLLFR